MLRKLSLIAMLIIVPLQFVLGQKKELAQARDNLKAGKSLVETEASMRKLLTDSANRGNEKIWLTLFEAVKKQYEAVNEKMYLKQSADTSQFFGTTYRMFGVLEGLDSIDAKPDSNGKVKLKFRKRNAEYLDSFRRNLFNGGLFHMARKEYQKAFDMFAAYVDCASQPLFAVYKYGATDRLLARAAFYALYNGYKQHNAEEVMRYAPVAQTDTAKLDMTCQYMAEIYKAQNDTVKYLDVLHTGFAKYPRSDYFFPHLFDFYFKNGDIEQASTVCDDAIKADSLNTITLFAKSTIFLTLKQYDKCIGMCEKIIALDSNHPDVYLNAGLAYFNQAVAIETSRKYSRDKRSLLVDLYRKALPYMEKYRKLAPNAQDKWAMPLYTIYLNLNMGKEFDEIDSLIRAHG